MIHVLDNIVWHALSGPQRKFALGNDVALRYAPGFSPIIGFAESERPDFAALAPFCELGEHLYCGGWSGQVPAGWRLEVDSVMVQMVYEGDMPEQDEAPDAVPLGAPNAEQALELAALTRPGPFGPRTIELGEYFGCFE